MTAVLATALVVFGAPNAIAIAHSISRWVRPYAWEGAPCPEERRAHDALGEMGEGVGVGHAGSNPTLWERNHGA
jgi:hypothetical protein